MKVDEQIMLADSPRMSKDMDENLARPSSAQLYAPLTQISPITNPLKLFRFLFTIPTADIIVMFHACWLANGKSDELDGYSMAYLKNRKNASQLDS